MAARMTADELRGLGFDPDTGRRVPASRGLSAGRDGQGRTTAPDSQNAPSAAQAVNAARGRSGKPSGNGGVARQPSKYGAIRTVAPASWGGTRLADSKAGAELARSLEALKIAGAILDWFEEVSLPVGQDEHGKVIRYRADAMVLLGYVDAPDGNEPALVVRFIDRKRGGMDTRTSAAKRAALRARGLNVEVRT